MCVISVSLHATYTVLFCDKCHREPCVRPWSTCRIYVTSAAQEDGARALPAARRRQTYVAAKRCGQKSLFIEGQRERKGRWLQLSHVIRGAIHRFVFHIFSAKFHSLPQHIYLSTSFHRGPIPACSSVTPTLCMPFFTTSTDLL